MRIVVSIDGGGIRGLISARLIQAVEQALGAPLASRADMLAGTSTGGIIAIGLAKGLPAKAMGDLYAQHGGAIFQQKFGGPVTRPKYDASELEAQLKAVLGTARLSDIKAPELIVPSYCVQLPFPEDTDGDGILEGAASWFFKSWQARTNANRDYPLWQVARATSAAPTFFPTAQVDGGYWMVDGGVFANNPSMCALASAWRLWSGEPIRVLSIGTGSKITALDGPGSQRWGLIDWASSVEPVFMDGAADAVAYQCGQLLGSNFLRCETALLGVSDAFDDASPLNIANLENLGAKFAADNVKRVTDFLTAGVPIA